jgi:hypothetical protein
VTIKAARSDSATFSERADAAHSQVVAVRHSSNADRRSAEENRSSISV